MLGACRRPTLPQSWQYAAALARTEGWAADFGIIRFGTKPIGLVQVQTRRWPLGFKSCRIFRGPLFIHDEIPGEMLKLVLGMLRQRYFLLRGRPLLFHPELPDTPANHERLTAVGFRRREAGYSTAWLDLSAELPALRAGLDGKWRNRLARAERLGVTAEVDAEGRHQDWLMERHAADKAARDYRGPTAATIRVFYEVAQGDADRPLLLRAHCGGQAVAGALFLRHGQSATYQVGWNAPEGRALGAQNLLLWTAIGHLRAGGTRWLDLGGFNADTPGIAHFKAGLGGAAVTLVGGYV